MAAKNFGRLLALLLAACTVTAAPAASKGWNFVQNGTSGVIALESMIISDNLAVFFDRATNAPLQVDNHTTWGAIWNMDTNTATPLKLTTDSFCAAGGFLSNGTMLNVGGHKASNPVAGDGRMGIRIMEPCEDPTGATCTVFDDPSVIHLVENRWYASVLRIFDGSMMIVGGMHEATPFYNTDPANNIEFWPPKDGGVPRDMPFLERTLPANMFPRTIALPDGKIFIAANNQTIIYDVETNTETRLPDIPNGVRVTNPLDGTATLLPLHPPHYIPEVLICGGTNTSDTIPYWELSSQDPATSQCSRMTLTPEGIAKGWELENMLEPRVMPEMILMPNGKVIIINGSRTGYAAFNSTRDPVSIESNSDHPVLTPEVYSPDAPLGSRFSNAGMPTSNIPRVYHSTVTLTPKGNLLIGGSNPNGGLQLVTDPSVKYPSEFRMEYLNPPYMSMNRPQLSNVPKKIAFNTEFTVKVSIPSGLNRANIQVALVDLGFSTHAFHFSSRLVFMDAKLSADGKSLTIKSPPNNRVYPPGPAYIYLTVDDVTSVGVRVMMGNGLPPPVADQGVPI